MAIKIDFLPFEDQVLRDLYGNCTELEAADLLEGPASQLSSSAEAVRIATAVLVNGIQAQRVEAETPLHAAAAKLLAYSHHSQKALTGIASLPYAAFLGLFDKTFYEPLPRLEMVFKQGRPCFGESGCDSCSYGTLTKHEVVALFKRCIEFSDQFISNGVEIGPVVEVLQPTANAGCELWFETVGVC